MKKCPKITLKQKQELQNIINDTGSSGKEVRRAQAVLLLDQETDIQMIVSLTTYSRRQIFDVRKSYLDKGIKAIKDRRKGKPKEILTQKQRNEVLDAVKTKTPLDYEYECDYWTTAILGDFIERQYKVRYKSKTSIYLIFKQARFTYHKPGRIYERRDETEVKKWRKTVKARVKKALSEPDTVILAEDEMSLSTQTTFQKIWLPKGEYPKIEVASLKKARSIYGFLNIRNGKEHAFKTEWQNMYITARVLRKLRKIYPTRKILLIWDQAPSHRGSKAQEFIKQDGNINAIYFPRAAPEENPQEHIWKKGRSSVTHNKFIKDIDKITDDFVDYLNKTEFKYTFQGFSAES